MKEIIRELYNSLQAEGFDQDDPTLCASLIVNHGGLEHNKRCLLAYLRFRMQKIEDLRWEAGRMIPANLKPNLSGLEQEHFNRYSVALEQYMKDCGVDLASNFTPPKDPYVEIRVLESCGEIFTDDGAAVKLEQNSTHYLKRSDIEHLVRQGFVEQTN
jgi:GINS complex subunit 1